jgi:hypothetical protein
LRSKLIGQVPVTACGVSWKARREMRIVIETVLEMLPPFRVAPGAKIVSEMFGMLQPRALPLVWNI